MLAALLLALVIPAAQAEDPRFNQHPALRRPRTLLKLPLQYGVERLDPGKAATTQALELANQLFAGLTRFEFANGTTSVLPDLAERWEASSDGMRYVFHLRNARWSDGAPLTAHDIVYAARRNIRPSTGSPFARLMYDIRYAAAIHNHQEPNPEKLGVRALDDLTLEVLLNRPASYFPALAGMWPLRPLPRHVIEKKGAHWDTPENVVGNGPYRISAHEAGKWVLLERSENFYDRDHVAIPGVFYRVVPYSSDGLELYEEGSLDYISRHLLPVPRSASDYILSHSRLKSHFSLERMMCADYLGMNPRRQPTSDPRLRKALAMAIDRGELAKEALDGLGQETTTMVPPPTFGAPEHIRATGLPFNPGLAKAELAPVGASGLEKMPPLEFLVNRGRPQEAVAGRIKKMLEENLGLKVHLDVREYQTFAGALEEPNAPHLFRLSRCANFPDAHDWLGGDILPVGEGRPPPWRNTAFEELIRMAGASQDQGERSRLYARAEKIITEVEVIIVPLYFHLSPTLTKPNIRAAYSPMGYNDIRLWSFRH